MSRPISSLAPNANPSTDQYKYTTPCNEPSGETNSKDTSCHSYSYSTGTGYQGYNWAWAIIVFIVLVIIIWLILWAVKPTWVQQTDPAGNPTGEVDNGKAFLWAVVIAIIISLIVWLVRAAASSSMSC